MDILVTEFIRKLVGSVCCKCTKGAPVFFAPEEDKLYHTECAEQRKLIQADLCHVVRLLIRDVDTLGIVYRYVVKYNPECLLRLDRDLRDYEIYHQCYKGGRITCHDIPTDAYLNLMVAMHGIFDGFDWNGFILCGAFLAKYVLSLNGNSYLGMKGNDPYYFVLNTSGYISIRERISYFCQFIGRRFMIDGPITVTVRNNKIKFYIPGFMRGIILHVNMSGSLDRLLSKSSLDAKSKYDHVELLDFSCDGKDFLVTAKGLYHMYSDTKHQFPKIELRGYLPYNYSAGVDTGKHPVDFTGIRKSDTAELVNDTFGEYSLHINLPYSAVVAYSIYKDWLLQGEPQTHLTVSGIKHISKDDGPLRVFIRKPNGDEIDYTGPPHVGKLRNFIREIVYANRI